MERKFTCPSCGGSYFGSSLASDGTLNRQCQSYGDGDPACKGSCDFRWNERDDRLYFHERYPKRKEILKRIAEVLRLGPRKPPVEEMKIMYGIQASRPRREGDEDYVVPFPVQPKQPQVPPGWRPGNERF